MSYSAVGKVWDPEGFADHVAGLDCLGWADSVTIHHTGTPNLSQRPKGWTIQHMRNLEHFYGMELGWSAGPHLFTDEDQVFGLSPLSEPGVHARSFNRSSIGIEMLGNYDFEDPMASRGAQVIRCTVQAVAALLKAMGLEPTPETIKFHRDDPRTSKTCPGTKVSKDWFVGLVRDEMGKAPAKPESAAVDLKQVLARVEAIEWQLARLKSLLP
jgi:hypothetical protein